ncbi:MAG TPA: N-acetylmuramoyl-L-alanine amidase, partial [Gemmatimonadaceae bacterium]
MRNSCPRNFGFLGALLIAIAACSPSIATPARAPVTRSTPAAPPPAPVYERGITPRPAPPLPSIPTVDGPLAPHLVFPEPNQVIPVRDSNFIFGSVGNGHASLTINGHSVPVAPNGTFLAYLPVPPATAPRYELVARTATDSARTDVPVRVPRPRVELPNTGRLVIDSGSVSPRGATLSFRDDEPIRVSLRAPLNAKAWVVADGYIDPLVNTSGNAFATDVPAGQMRNGGILYVMRGADTVHLNLSRVPAPDTTRFVMLGDASSQADTDAYVIARPAPAATYKWMLIPGTIVQETGKSGDNIRVRLDNQLEVWVDAPSVRPLPAGYPSPRRTIGPMSFVPYPGYVDVVMPVNSPPPFLVEQYIDHIALTVYGATANPDIIKFLKNDSLVRMVNWVPEASDRVRMTFELTQHPYGYLVLYDQGRLILRLRRPPRVSLARPLDGLTITVDPGHPPGGAIGPTGYTEAQGVLAVGLKLRDLLEQRGAKVVMTRTDMEAVDLHLRSVIARQTNSNALLSVHENAFGDGVNPFVNNGTSTLFFHPQSEPLARLVQAAMMREFGLRDLGIHYQNIAIGRTTWMPSIISEGLFLMVPDQENAAKTPEFQ